jgi:CotH kinase protein
MTRLCLTLAVVVGAGCTGTIQTFDEVDAGVAEPDASPCVPPADDLPPAKPTILSPLPVSGKPNVIEPATVVFTADAFSDADDDFGAADFEILADDGGAPGAVIWRAHVTDPAKLASGVTLADGSFVVGELFAWSDYHVRVTYRSDRSPCGAASEPSAPVAFRTDDNSAVMFDDSQVREVKIYMSQESYDAINAQAIIPNGACIPFHRDYYAVDVVYEGIRYEDVGAHVKGGCGSNRQLDKKASFKIGLRWDDPDLAGCPDNPRLFGQTHLTLNNGVQDCSHEHERMAYALYEAMGVPSPRQAHVRVYVNDVYWGVYLNVESFDRRMMARRFGGNGGGMLYEGTYGCSLWKGNLQGDIDADRCDMEFSQNECDSAPEPGDDPQDFTPLRTLVDQLDAIPAGQFYPDAGQYLDMDEWLSLLAANVVMHHWDDTFRGGNNYRVYHDLVSGKWKLLSSGVDQTYADEWWVWWRDHGHVFSARCFSERDCIDAFEAKLDLAVQKLQELDLPAFADRIHETIRPYAEMDPRRECDNNAWNNTHNDLKNWIDSRPARLPMFRLSDGFEADVPPRWTKLAGGPASSVFTDGDRLIIEQSAVGRWTGSTKGSFMSQPVTGNFRATAWISARNNGGGEPTQNANSYAGLMLRGTGNTGNGEDYAFSAVGRDGSGYKILWNYTANGATSEATVPYTGLNDGGDDGFAQLRICRFGSKVRLFHVYRDAADENKWKWQQDQERDLSGDFGATLQVGLMASSDDVSPAFRSTIDWLDFYPITDIDQCDD